MTVPVVGDPPVTDVGLNVTAVGSGAWTLRFAVVELPPMVAVIVSLVFVETAEVVITNCFTVWPAATVTEVGTVADGSLELRLTTVPPAGAADARVTAPSEFTPPATAAGLTERVKFADALSVNVAVDVAPLRTAVRLPV